MLACAREIRTVVRQSCPVYLFSQTDEPLDSEERFPGKGFFRAFGDNFTIEFGVAAGLGFKVEVPGAKVGASLGKLTAVYRFSLSGKDEGRLTAQGITPTIQVGSLIKWRSSTPRVTQIQDTDLGPRESWREEVSDGEFSQDWNGRYSADGPGKIAVGIESGVKITVQFDVFKMIHEM